MPRLSIDEVLARAVRIGRPAAYAGPGPDAGQLWRDAKKPDPLSLAARVLRYERGEATQEEAVALMQALLDSGRIASMGPHYRDTAARMRAAGLIH